MTEADITPYPKRRGKATRNGHGVCHRFTKAQERWIRKYYPHFPNAVLVARSAQLTVQKIRDWATRNGIRKSPEVRRSICTAQALRMVEMRDHKALGRRLSNLYRLERGRMVFGMEQKTKLHVPALRYTKQQMYARSCAKTRGYILTDARKEIHGRYAVYYTPSTKRGKIFERNLTRMGFILKPVCERQPQTY